MNKVIIIHLNGHAYQVEETGYDALRVYLDNAAQRLAKNPDRDEIISDIEQAIAEKFRTNLTSNKSVIVASEVHAVIAEMGPVQDESLADDSLQSEGSSANDSTQSRSTREAGADFGANRSTGPARRLYKIPEGALFAGVCNGFAAYFALDAVVVRLGFVLIAAVFAIFALLVHWFFFLPIIGYAACIFILPTAHTAEERAAARGAPSTAEEYIRRAKQGYYAGVRSFGTPSARKKWRKRMKQEMRDHAYQWRHYTPEDARPTSHALSFAMPILGVLEVLITGGFILSLIALIKNRELLGIELPLSTPLWVGIAVVFVVFQIVRSPIKALRWASYSHGYGKSYAGCGRSFFDSLASIAAIAACLWAADRYIPAFHEFVLTLPARTDEAATALKNWWAKR